MTPTETTGQRVSGEDALREALIDALCAFDEEIGAGIPPEETADALLPAVLRYGRETAAEELRAAASAIGGNVRPLRAMDVRAWLNTRAAALANKRPNVPTSSGEACATINPETGRSCVLARPHDGMHRVADGRWYGEVSQ